MGLVEGPEITKVITNYGKCPLNFLILGDHEVHSGVKYLSN